MNDSKTAQSAADRRDATPRASDSGSPTFFGALLADARLAAAYRGERHEFRSRLDAVVQALRLMLQTDAFLGLVAYRMEARLRARGIPVLPWLAHRLAIVAAQLSIADTVVVHPGVFIPNGQVVIYGRAEIQPLATLFPGAIVGPLGFESAGPTIGGGTRIGPGAKVLGEVEVGANSIVGANAVVVDDVPPGTTVVGMPARAVDD